MAWVTTYDEILLTIAKNYKDIETSIVNQLLLEVRTIILRKAPTEKPCGNHCSKWLFQENTVLSRAYLLLMRLDISQGKSIWQFLMNFIRRTYLIMER